MKRTLLFSVMIGSLSTLGACQSGPGSARGSASSALGEACQVSTDCGAGLECQIENGAGTCVKHGGDGQEDNGANPEAGDDKGGGGGKDDKGQKGADDGGKAEDNHSPDGGVDDKGQGADDKAQADGGQVKDDGNKVDDHGGDQGGQGKDDGGVQPPPQVGCASNADCQPGEECEIEHGVGTCKQHGGK